MRLHTPSPSRSGLATTAQSSSGCHALGLHYAWWGAAARPAAALTIHASLGGPKEVARCSGEESEAALCRGGGGGGFGDRGGREWGVGWLVGIKLLGFSGVGKRADR